MLWPATKVSGWNCFALLHCASVLCAAALFTAPAFPAQAFSAPSIINKVQGGTPGRLILWPHEAD
jgi:hypothetical protein